MNLPTLLPESQIHPFSYYWEGEVRSGMTLRGRLYALLDCFPEQRRAIAYETGCKLAEEHEVVITVGKDTHFYYGLWIALCPSTSQILQTYTCQRTVSQNDSPSICGLLQRGLSAA